MLPIRDIQERRSFPIVNIALIVVNIGVFLYEVSLGKNLEGFIHAQAWLPANFFEPSHGSAEAKSVFVSLFLHGGWMLLGGNMLYLWIFGDNVEDRLGHIKYIFFYLGCGWLATLAHGYTGLHSSVPSIGASGAIA